MLYTNVGSTNVINGNRNSAGTIVTIPAGGVFNGDISISGSMTGVGTGRCTVTLSTTSVNGTMAPANGAVIADLTVAGLLGVTSSNSSQTEAFVYAPTDQSVDLVFSLGGTSAASVVINGFNI